MARFATLIVIFFSLPIFADIENRQMEITEIAEGVFLHITYADVHGYGVVSSNGLVVVSGNDAYIIDTPWPKADTVELVRWIEGSGYTLKASLSTHFHEDRTSGIAYLNGRGVQTYASTATNTLLESIGSEQASIAFEGPAFSLLDGAIDVYYPGAGHTSDNLVVWLSGPQLLVGGCLIRPTEWNGLGNLEDASVEDYPVSVQRVIDRYPDVLVVVPGHGEFGGAELLGHTLVVAERVRARGE